jgi:hypothetical protein
MHPLKTMGGIGRIRDRLSQEVFDCAALASTLACGWATW